MIGRFYRIGNRRHVWRCVQRGAPFDRGPRKNVLLELVGPDGPVGMRIVRPFRGLRRVA